MMEEKDQSLITCFHRQMFLLSGKGCFNLKSLECLGCDGQNRHSSLQVTVSDLKCSSLSIPCVNLLLQELMQGCRVKADGELEP